MPELPEVETIARDLDRNLRGKAITAFRVTNEKTRRARPFLNLSENKSSTFLRGIKPRGKDILSHVSTKQSLKEFQKVLDKFRQIIIGKKIIKISRRAKMLIFDLGDDFLLAHLKMTGQLILKKPKGKLLVGGHPIMGVGVELPNKFTRAIISLTDGSRLYFNDIRRFGWLKLLNKKQLSEELSDLGPEPLSEEFTAKALAEMLARKAKTAVKPAIMDQNQLSGVGNIYADEALFAAKIKPSRLAGSLKSAEIIKLHSAIVKILKLSIKHRGTSFSDYRDGHSQPGGFVKHLKIYGRAGKPCKICGRHIKKGKIGGRGTHWCGYCQK